MAEKLSAKQAAIEIGTDARTLRKFLRSDASAFDAVGQGNRYEFSNGDLKKLKKQFIAWNNSGKKAAEKVIEEDPNIEEEIIDEPDEAYEMADEGEEDPFEDLDIEDEVLPPDHHAGLDEDEDEENYCAECDRHFKNARGVAAHNAQKHADD